VECGLSSSSHVIVWIPVSDARRYRKPKALAVKPLDCSAVHVSSFKEFCVSQHHPEQQCLDFIHPTSSLVLRALWPVNLNPAEETSGIFHWSVKATFPLLPIDFENSSGNYVVGHATSPA